jgi:hypothetical protein
MHTQPFGHLAGPIETAENNVCTNPWLWLFIALGLGYAIGILTAPGARMFSR